MRAVVKDRDRSAELAVSCARPASGTSQPCTIDVQLFRLREALLASEGELARASAASMKVADPQLALRPKASLALVRGGARLHNGRRGSARRWAGRCLPSGSVSGVL